MYKNITGIFLAVAVAISVVISPLSITYASAAVVTSQDITNQKQVVEEEITDSMYQYIRLLMYMVIYNLERQVEEQNDSSS